MSTLTGVDETGSRRDVGVDGDRLKVRSITTDEIEAAVAGGLGFQMYSGKITITTDVQQMVFSLENNEANDIFITSGTFGTSSSTNGVDNVILIEQVGNILASDPIISASDALVTNRNGGSPRAFDGTVKKGPAAMAGTEVETNGTLGDFTRSKTFAITAQLTKGGRIGIAVTPPAGNTNMDLTLVVIFHIVNGI